MGTAIHLPSEEGDSLRWWTNNKTGQPEVSYRSASAERVLGFLLAYGGRVSALNWNDWRWEVRLRKREALAFVASLAKEAA